MTYTELEAAVKSWLNRNNFAALEAEIPTFFSLAQSRIDRDPDFKMIELIASEVVSTGTPSIPGGFSKGIAYTFDDGCQMKGANIAEVEALKGTPGTPTLIAPAGTEFIFGPPPNTDRDFTVYFYRRETPISSTNESNTLSTQHPELILFAVLLEACLWLKDDQRAAVWEGRYQQTMDGIAIHEELKQWEPGSIDMRGGSQAPVDRGGF